ncbi:hypothetical protein BHE74_00005790 [Ensete ventricosum]|nr:hypothetical protein BHE74_00005790 [Ensete ventricosum]
MVCGKSSVNPQSRDLVLQLVERLALFLEQATERFEAIYPTLKELALAGSPGTKTTKQASQQLLPLTVQAIQESMPDRYMGYNSELAKEATDIFIWCLIQNAECYRQWAFYSVVQNEEALSGDDSISKQASIKDADKYCKVVLRKSASRSSCMKFGVVLILVIAICFSLFPNMKLLAWEKLNEVFQL